MNRKVAFGLINYHSPIVERIQSCVLPTIAHYPDWTFELICVDNDPTPSRQLLDFLGTMTVPVKYLWNGGANLMAAASTNQLYALTSSHFLVYVCANHGRMFDPTWLEDLLHPFHRPRIAMSGTLLKFPLDSIGEGSGTCAYIQGGVFAARVELLRKHPLTDRFPHGHCDEWISWELLRNGYGLANVPTVVSLWRTSPPPDLSFKFVHGAE